MNREPLIKNLQDNLRKYDLLSKQEKEAGRFETDDLVTSYLSEIRKGHQRCDAQEQASGRIYFG